MTRTEERQYMKKAFENTPRHKVKTHNNGFIMTLFNTKYHFEPYCLEFSKIENYEKAKAEDFKGWHCHHRLEKEHTRKELIELGLYFNRPAEELIFLTNREHIALHNKYNQEKGFQPAKGHRWKLSEERSRANSEKFKNRIWVNNGVENKRVLPDKVPEGFVIGRIKNFNKGLHKGKTWIINSQGKREWK